MTSHDQLFVKLYNINNDDDDDDDENDDDDDDENNKMFADGLSDGGRCELLKKKRQKRRYINIERAFFVDSSSTLYSLLP